MNHRLTLYLSFPLFRLVSGNLGRWVCAHTLSVYKVFTKTGRGPWLRGDSALDPPTTRSFKIFTPVCQHFMQFWKFAGLRVILFLLGDFICSVP